MPNPNEVNDAALVPMVWCFMCGSYVREANTSLTLGETICLDAEECYRLSHDDRPLAKGTGGVW